MKIALTNIYAAASARLCGRSAFVRTVVLGCAVACAGAPAYAGQDRGRDGQRDQQMQSAEREQQRAAPPPHVQPRGEQRQYDPRAFDAARAEEQRRQAAQQQQQLQQEQGRRGGRLTPDERRELRRQIDEAGIDLYPNAPRR